MLAEPPPIDVGDIDVEDTDDNPDDGVLCIEGKFGTIDFRIEGFGGYAKIYAD